MWPQQDASAAGNSTPKARKWINWPIGVRERKRNIGDGTTAPNDAQETDCAEIIPRSQLAPMRRFEDVCQSSGLMRLKPSKCSSSARKWAPKVHIIILPLLLLCLWAAQDGRLAAGQTLDALPSSGDSPAAAASSSSPTASCFGGLQTFEKISMSSFENPSSAGSSAGSFGSGVLVQQDDQALTNECVNLCRSQSNCLSFVIDYNKFECKSYATTQQELQHEFDTKFQPAARSVSNSSTSGGGGSNSDLNSNSNSTDGYVYQAASSSSNVNFQQLLPSASSNYFEKICLDGIANRNQFADVCGPGRLWTIERVVDSFLDGFVEKEVTNVNNKDECSKLCIFETQFVCRSADYDQSARLCRLSKEDRRTQPQAMRQLANSNRQYLENQCATPGPSSCVYESRKNLSIISMDALKFAQTVQDCQMKCNSETTFNCRSYSFYQQRCFLSGDDSVSLNSQLVKLPVKAGWLFGEKKCLVELCTRGIFSYEKITGYTLRSALSTNIDLMMSAGSTSQFDYAAPPPQLQQPELQAAGSSPNASLVANMMMLMMSTMAANSRQFEQLAAAGAADPLQATASNQRRPTSSSQNNLAITEHCRQSCDLGYLNCPAFAVDYKNNRCQRLDRNSQGRHHELVARDGHAYYEKICLRVPEIMSMCQDKYWIFERVIGYELAPRLYDKTLKFVQSRRDCEEYCLEEKQFQCRSALYNDETSECKLSRWDRRLALLDGAYYRNFNVRLSYLENQCVRDQTQAGQCRYEQPTGREDQPAYPTFTERIETAASQQQHQSASSAPSQQFNDIQAAGNMSSRRTGAAYCERLCNDNAKFQCHSFGYYASTGQCFLSGDDSISAGESALTPSSGFVYFEKKCRPSSSSSSNSNNLTSQVEQPQTQPPAATQKPRPVNPYLAPQQPPSQPNFESAPTPAYGYDTATPTLNDVGGPVHPISNSNISVHIDQQINNNNNNNNNNVLRPTLDNNTNLQLGPNQYKCGLGHTFVYQRIPGFEPIGGYLTLLVKNNEMPGIVEECARLCTRAFECRAFILDYKSNQCFAMLENSSVGSLSLRQIIGRDYFEGFCIQDHLLLAGNQCANKIWIVDKIVDQAVVGVQHQKLIGDSSQPQCRQSCLEERLFWCKSAMFDSATGDCKLYSIDRESIPQMRLLFTRGVDFFENQCQISASSCPYDAIERDMSIAACTKSIQSRSTFDCELACNQETAFNCRSYTYLDQYPSLPNLCQLSSDSRSTSQRGSVREHSRSLYAERNCYYRRPRIPGNLGENPKFPEPPEPPAAVTLPDHQQYGSDMSRGYDRPLAGPQQPPPAPPTDGRTTQAAGLSPPTRMAHEQLDSHNSLFNSTEPFNVPALGQGCEPHQHTFERTFGYDFRSAPKERAQIAPTIGIAVGCQQECLRRDDRCQSFVVDYSLPYQSCFLIDAQVGANKKLLVRSPNSAYFEKVCLPRTGLEMALSMAAGAAGNELEHHHHQQQQQYDDTVGHMSHSPLRMSAALKQAANSLDPMLPDSSLFDIMPSYGTEPWSPQLPAANQLPYYLHHQQQHLMQNYPSRACPKLWSFERFVNHNFTAPADRLLENCLTRAQCETHCINEAAFMCRSATYDYQSRVCRLFKNTRRTLLSQFVDLELDLATGDGSSQPNAAAAAAAAAVSSAHGANSHPGTAHVLPETGTGAAPNRKQRHQSNVVQPMASTVAATTTTQFTAEPSSAMRNIDYLENTCSPEPASCQYRSFYDQFSPYIDKLAHASSLTDCQRQCDQERLFSCKSINYDPMAKSCMLINEDLISLSRQQHHHHHHQTQLSGLALLLAKKNTIYSEKGNCEMISVQCNSQEMLVNINFDSPFRGRIMAKGNPEQCFQLGDGQTTLQFPIVFGPKCNSRQEGHNTFVNELVIQHHPIIMTDNDKTVRVMCAFEAPDQIISLKSPNSQDNRTVGIDVALNPANEMAPNQPNLAANTNFGASIADTSGRTRHNKQHFSSVVSSKAAPPNVLLKILEANGRDASTINLGDELMLKIQMQLDGQQNSALGIFARNLMARSSNGETLLLIDNDGCPVDSQVFPALEVDAKDGKSLFSIFKAFRFPSSGLVNFEVQIRFCPEQCQPVDCARGAGPKSAVKSYGRKRRKRRSAAAAAVSSSEQMTSIIQSVNSNQEQDAGSSRVLALDSISTVMKPKAFEYVKKLVLGTNIEQEESKGTSAAEPNSAGESTGESLNDGTNSMTTNVESPTSSTTDEEFDNSNDFAIQSQSDGQQANANQAVDQRRDSILMHIDEKIVPNAAANANNLRVPPNGQSISAPYGRFPTFDSDPRELMSQVLQTSAAKSDGPQVAAPETATEPSQPAGHKHDQREPESMLPTEAADGNTLPMEPTDSTSDLDQLPATTTVAPQDQVAPSVDQRQTRQNQANNKELPLKFSILVGENQPATPVVPVGWLPISKPTHSSISKVAPGREPIDHVVVPGGGGSQYEELAANSSPSTDQSSSSSSSANFNPQKTHSFYLEDNKLDHQHDPNASGHAKRNASYEHSFEALVPSNSVSSEIKVDQNPRHQADQIYMKHGHHSGELSGGADPQQLSESAHSDCRHQSEWSSKSRLRTIIWAGGVVIALNVCLVIVSLLLYFKRAYFGHIQHHSVVGTSPDCGPLDSSSRLGGVASRWPSVLLKSKQKLATSLSTNEHFFYKLNSNHRYASTSAASGADLTSIRGSAKSSADSHAHDHHFNWPNLSASSTHSTISSLATPTTSSGICINHQQQQKHHHHIRPSLKVFEAQSSLKSGNFTTGHKVHQANDSSEHDYDHHLHHHHRTLMDAVSSGGGDDRQHRDGHYSARYTNNLDETFAGSKSRF